MKLKLPLIFGLADALWAFSALKAAPVSNGADSVGLINAVVWIFLHLPAAWLGSLPFKNQGAAAGVFPPGQLALIGSLGVLQMAAIAYGIGFWLDKKKNP